jgi:hypothetical protein
MVSHPARALTVFPQAGASRDYVRVQDDDGRAFWCLAKPTFGQGEPREPRPDAPRLTPAQLAEQLAGELE